MVLLSIFTNKFMSRHSIFSFFLFLGVAVSLFVGGEKSSVNGRINIKENMSKKVKVSKKVNVSINKKRIKEEEESLSNVVVGVVASCVVVALGYAGYNGYKYMRAKNASIVNSRNNNSGGANIDKQKFVDEDRLDDGYVLNRLNEEEVKQPMLADVDNDIDNDVDVNSDGRIDEDGNDQNINIEGCKLQQIRPGANAVESPSEVQNYKEEHRVIESEREQQQQFNSGDDLTQSDIGIVGIGNVEVVVSSDEESDASMQQQQN